MRRSLAVIMLLHLAGLSAEAVPSLHSLFSDHMILQQGKPIPIWGRADPGGSGRGLFRIPAHPAMLEADHRD